MGISPMAAPENWESEETLDAFLASQLNKGRLALVLGAGASFGFGLPGWDQLISRMYQRMGEDLPTSGSGIDHADLLRHKKFSGDSIGFAKFVRECLFEDVQSLQEDVLLKSKLLQAIGAMLSKSARGTATSTISFNFDDVLELYLEVLGLVVCSTDAVPAWNNLSDVEILHPHGLLPFQESERVSARGIVFTAADYLEVVGDRVEPWNSRMFHIMTSNTCLFIGLSGADTRLMSLLQQVKRAHPAMVLENNAYWGVRTTKQTDDEMTRHLWNSKGVALREFNDYPDIPSWLLSICRRAAKDKL